MRRVALTGGIGTGKTHVARQLGALGIPVIDSDAIVHESLGPGGPLVERVAARFGRAVRAADGGIDRRALASIVFRDPAARRDLEGIIHPYVFERISGWLASLDQSAPFAVADIPLLFETDSAGKFDKVIVTAAPRELQIARVVDRDGASREEAEGRLAAQWPIEAKIARADYVIHTDGSKEETNRQVAAIVDELKKGD
jgi:dephospho-CoA kinase